MNDLDVAARAALDRWRADAAEPAWADVLERAGVATRRARPRRTLLIAAVVAVGLLMSIPAFGVGERITSLITGSKRPGIGFAAEVETAAGVRVARFSLRTSRLLVALAGPRNRPRPMPFRRPGPLLGVTARWSLELERPATEVRLERILPSKRHVLVAELCTSCSGTQAGSLRLRRPALGALFSGRMIVTVRTAAGSAAGVVRVQPPRR
jgi:hypothetical protein